MENKNEVAEKKDFTTSLSQWSNEFTGLVSRDFEQCGVTFDEYSKTCAMSAMSTIYQLVKSSGKNIGEIDTSNLREIVGQCASLKLNASATPRECYFQLRNKKIGQSYVQTVEMGIEGDGNDAMLRNFGQNVDTVYPVWLVKEGDDFVYPKHKGVTLTDPEWEEKGLSQKVVRVVYPIKMADGNMTYLIAERDSVRVNLIAHVRNNLMNETFGLVKGGKKTRYDATEAEKKAIEAKKEEIYAELRKCQTVDEMLSCVVAIPYISAAWLDTPESMIVRKMRNNAIKKFPKNMNTMASRSILELDETYKESREEIEQNAGTDEFVEADCEASDGVERVQGDVVDGSNFN